MRMFKSLVLLFLVPVVRGSMVQLKNGGYEDIVIAINPGLPEDNNIITNIQVRTFLFVYMSFCDIQTSCNLKRPSPINVNGRGFFLLIFMGARSIP